MNVGNLIAYAIMGHEYEQMAPWFEGTMAGIGFRVAELAEAHKTERERVADLETALDSEKRQHDETRGYRQAAEDDLESTRDEVVRLQSVIDELAESHPEL